MVGLEVGFEELGDTLLVEVEELLLHTHSFGFPEVLLILGEKVRKVEHRLLLLFRELLFEFDVVMDELAVLVGELFIYLEGGDLLFFDGLEQGALLLLEQRAVLSLFRNLHELFHGSHSTHFDDFVDLVVGVGFVVDEAFFETAVVAVDGLVVSEVDDVGVVLGDDSGEVDGLVRSIVHLGHLLFQVERQDVAAEHLQLVHVLHSLQQQDLQPDLLQQLGDIALFGQIEGRNAAEGLL